MAPTSSRRSRTLIGTVPRSNDFRPDPDLAPDQQAQVSDYSHSGYIPGQLLPAASMRWSARAMSESFLLSNTAPRTDSMNNGIWNTLEQKVRDRVDSRGKLYVVSGNIYNSSNPKTIGPDHVAVPSAFYKVIFDPIQVDTIAFIIPNRKESPLDLPKFITSVNKVEQETGLDFLPNIDDPVESLIEARISPFWIR
jgi:endonuclease G, mitochondrial